MQRQNPLAVALLLAGTALFLHGCMDNPAPVSTEPVRGATNVLGNGTVSTYAQFDAAGAPTAIGVVFSAGALAGLTTAPTDGHHCFDRNGDGTVEAATECTATHEMVIPLPDAAARRADIPFKWTLFNWNPIGHMPPGVYDTPHFDIHFMIEPIENIFAIETGACGPEFVRCDQFELAKKPLPPNYVAPDYQDVEAVAPAMGNHLIDPTSSEFQGEAFTRTWIYGIYDGRITFYEEMVTQAYLLSQPDTCYPIKSPPAVGLGGYYPTQSCMRYDAEADEYTVSMEGFVMRQASAPEPIPATS